jgi:hypothetical protein
MKTKVFIDILVFNNLLLMDIKSFRDRLLFYPAQFLEHFASICLQFRSDETYTTWVKYNISASFLKWYCYSI